jgi:DNA-binding LytR/AlgR family response regulator
MKLFIAEDEPPARERLIESLSRVAPEAQVVGSAASVHDTRRWLATHAEPDVLLLDIQLADGLSTELFADGALALPTIFTTAYDEFALAAFQALAIDYLLKPVDDTQLARAFARVASLRERFAAPAAKALREAMRSDGAAPRHRQRWVARQGAAFIAVPVEQVAYFVSVDKLSFVVTRDGTRRLLDESLADIEAALDPEHFFRVNRQMIVAATAIARFAPSSRGRLSAELIPAADGDVQISQERAAAFRQWLAR